MAATNAGGAIGDTGTDGVAQSARHRHWDYFQERACGRLQEGGGESQVRGLRRAPREARDGPVWTSERNVSSTGDQLGVRESLMVVSQLKVKRGAALFHEYWIIEGRYCTHSSVHVPNTTGNVACEYHCDHYDNERAHGTL